MFKKIVSNITFSPALIGQLNEYSKNIRKERSIRRLGLVFAILTVSIQLFALSQPPEAANAKKDYISSETSSELIKDITSTNASQGFIDSESKTAMPGDQISYTLTVQNNSDKITDFVFTQSISDILEYSALIDTGGGLYSSNNGNLTWPKTTIDKNSKQTRSFVIRLMDQIPATSTSVLNEKSYDCSISSTFGNDLSIKVSCPIVKTVENIVSQLPKAGNVQNITFAIVLIISSIYYCLRTNQLDKEIHIIRKDITTGTI